MKVRGASHRVMDNELREHVLKNVKKWYHEVERMPVKIEYYVRPDTATTVWG